MNNFKRQRDLVVVGGTLSDAHVVSIYMVTLFLEEKGYEVLNLSCCNPTANFFTSVPQGRPVTAFVVANQNGCALADLQDLPSLKLEFQITSPIVLGGHYYVGCVPNAAIKNQLLALGITCILDSPEELLAYLQSLRGNSEPVVETEQIALSVACTLER